MLQTAPGGAGQGLHGAGDPIYSNISWWNYTYENGRMHTGQINVAWQLRDVTASDGGFVVGASFWRPACVSASLSSTHIDRRITPRPCLVDFLIV